MNDDDFVSLCGHGNIEAIRAALEAGANPNAAEEIGWTALMAAVQNNSPEEAVALLLGHGAKVDDGENMANGTPLMSAVSQSKIGVVKLLIEAGADVNAVNDWELTVMRIAKQKGNSEVIRLLLDAGANLQSGDWQPEFP